MMKQLNCAETPPSITLRIGLAAAHSLQLRRGLRVKRPNVQGPRGPPGKSQNNGTIHHPSQISCLSKQPWGSTLVIQRQEMAAYFRLFGEGKVIERARLYPHVLLFYLSDWEKKISEKSPTP